VETAITAAPEVTLGEPGTYTGTLVTSNVCGESQRFQFQYTVASAFNLIVEPRFYFAKIGNLFEFNVSEPASVELAAGHTASAEGTTCRVENPSFLPHSRSGFNLLIRVENVPSTVDEVPVDLHVTAELDAGLTVASGIPGLFFLGQCCDLPIHSAISFDRIITVKLKRENRFSVDLTPRLESLSGNAEMTFEVLGLSPGLPLAQRLGPGH
jgi:hypothetical protein